MEKDNMQLDEIRFKTFPVRMSMKMNAALRDKAFKEGVTVHQLVLKALTKELSEQHKAV